jgi:hypothetical protein
LLIGIAAVTAAVVAAIAAAAGGGEEPAGGVLPELDVRQSAVAEDAGVVVAARRAHFSGTATLVELEARLEGTETAARLAIEPTGISWSSGPLPDGYGWWSAPAGSPGILRLTPVVPGQEASLEIRRITVFAAEGGTPEVRNGSWKLALDLPADLPKRVRTENLRGASVTDGGVTVTLEGAVRSTSETLITVRVTSAGPVSHVGEPTIVVDGKVLYGGLAAAREEGTLLTYTFPPTPFGSGVEVRFGPFEAHGTAEPGERLSNHRPGGGAAAGKRDGAPLAAGDHPDPADRRAAAGGPGPDAAMGWLLLGDDRERWGPAVRHEPITSTWYWRSRASSRTRSARGRNGLQ